MFEIIVKTQFGLEEELVKELEELGAKEINILTRAVRCYGNQEMLYKINLHSRLAIKVLKPIASFKVFNEGQLYTKVKEINWADYMTKDQTFAIDGVTSGTIFTHSQYVALKSKDAIADQFRENEGARPSIDVKNPDLRINIHIMDSLCNVSLDSSGLTLAKRGYRQIQTLAPISEVLAAGILRLSGWDMTTPLYDPMCGSGTFSIEAALMAANIAPGRHRSFAFEKWKDFDETLWEAIKTRAEKQVKSINLPIVGSDQDQTAIRIAKENAERAGVSNLVSFEQKDFFETKGSYGAGVIVINPPYGERLEKPDDIIPLYKEMGTQLKHSYDGSDAWIISSNLRALKFVGLRPSKKIKLYNGKLECRLNKFELYRGSKKGQPKS